MVRKEILNSCAPNLKKMEGASYIRSKFILQANIFQAKFFLMGETPFSWNFHSFFFCIFLEKFSKYMGMFLQSPEYATVQGP